MRRWVGALAGTLALASSSVAVAAPDPPKDYADVARNIIPSGQYGSVPPPPEADRQARMYDELTPLFDEVSNDDLFTFFKSEALGIGTDGPVIAEETPRPGVRIVRDSFNVPHVTADTYEDGIWAAGWIAAQDRGLLLSQARYNARVAAIDAPGLSALGLIAGLQNFRPSAQTEAEVAKQTQVLERKGKEGRKVLADIDTFISGINDYYAQNSPSTEPFTRNDIYALNALKGQFVGQGGGDEARRSQFLGGLAERLGPKQGYKVFRDLRQFKNPELPTSIDGRFPYGRIPRKQKGSVVLDPGSFEATPAAENARRLSRSPVPSRASNVLMIGKSRSKTNRPLMVGGPQIGYFYPGLTYEIDMNAPGLVWRGATSAPFPGYMLIGRGQDFATTLTSSGGDIIDQYVERLCGGSEEMYRFKGECLPMERFDAGTLNGRPVSFLRTVHGPVVGYATMNGGERVAISQKRSSYGRDVTDQLFFRRLSTGRVDDVKSFFNAAAKTPQTFNSFYLDSENIALYTSGRLPVRPKSLDPGLPALGTGKYEWEGFISKREHIQGKNPRDGTITNWNQGAARGFAAADDDWGKNGSVQRNDLLDFNLARLREGGEWDLASVTGAMNAAATQDVRAIRTVPLLRRLLKGAPAPSERAQEMIDLLSAWRKNGGSRLDRDLDGSIDDPGAAIIDTAWPRIADAFMAPRLGPQLDELDSLFSRYDQPPGGQFSGWHQYFDRDIRALLGRPVKSPFRVAYCGKGRLGDCRRDVWAAVEAAGAELEAEQGTADPAAWRADATAERIEFVPGLLPYTMRYTNRPSGIQQVISFRGQR